MTLSTRARELTEQGDRLFSKRQPLLSLWQTIADNFYPIRADFTTKHALGEEFASHLMTGKPVLVHRELSNAFSSMLRPRGKVWFKPRTNNSQINEDSGSRAFLDDMGETMLRVMYEKRAQFVRATKQGDADFSAFGQAALQVRPNQYKDGLLYRNWHLRDVAWCENAEGEIDQVHCNYNLSARDYVKYFPKTAAQSVKDIVSKEPHKEIKCRHIVVPVDMYDLEVKNKDRFRFVCLYVDIDNNVVLEEVPQKRLGFVIPRWVTIAGSQYAYSPATTIALPDARMLQQISLTLLEAGQKAVDPPLKATKDVVGTVNTYAGGITWVDEEYDERLGAALEPLIAKDNAGALAWGQKYQEKIEQSLMDMFYLSKLSLPPAEVDGDMTKWEAQQRVEEYIRNALPLFEPMEVEYNGGLCEETFQQCMDLNLFGSFENMPPALRGQEIRWQFESPLQEAIERTKYQQSLMVANLMQTAAQANPGILHDIDTTKMFRDAVLGTGAPADWLVPEEIAQQQKAQAAREQMAQQLAAAVGTGADVAGKVGAGLQQLQAAGVPV